MGQEDSVLCLGAFIRGVKFSQEKQCLKKKTYVYVEETKPSSSRRCFESCQSGTKDETSVT